MQQRNISHIPSEPIEIPHDYEEGLDEIIMDSTGDFIGTYIHQVTLDNENIYHLTSTDNDIVDLKLSKLACEAVKEAFCTSTFKDI
jgi:hypothetical protein